MKKRLLSTLLALCVALALLPVTALAAENVDDVIGIYLGSKNVWLAEPDDFFEDSICYYGLLDFEGDGVPELFLSECMGSGIFSSNVFYKIDVNTRTVSRMQNVPDDLNDLDLGYSGVRIYRDGQTGQLLYYSEDTFNMGLSDWGSLNIFFYMQNGALSTRRLWGQRTIDWDTEYFYYTGSGSETAVSESEWTRYQEGYLNRYTLLAKSVPTADAMQMSRANDEALKNTLRRLYGELYQSVSAAPATPSGTPATGAVLSPQKLTVDGKNIECEKYNINDSNYFKLRDLAKLLSGTGSQFEVGYDEAAKTVSITTGAPYTPAGTELAAGVDNSATAQPSSQAILINGEKHGELTVYNIGGSNFFQLRELGKVLGFDVGYDQATNTAIVNSVQK